MKNFSFALQSQQVSTSVQRRQDRRAGSQNNTVRGTCLHQLTEGAKQGRVASEQIRHFLLPAQTVQIHSSQFHTRVKPHFYSKGGGCAPPLQCSRTRAVTQDTHTSLTATAGCQACATLLHSTWACPEEKVTRLPSHTGLLHTGHRLFTGHTPSNRSFCKTQAHEEAEAKTKSWSSLPQSFQQTLTQREDQGRQTKCCCRITSYTGILC